MDENIIKHYVQAKKNRRINAFIFGIKKGLSLLQKPRAVTGLCEWRRSASDFELT